MRDIRDLADRNCARYYIFFINSWLRRFAKAGPKSEVKLRIGVQNIDKICIAPVYENDLEVKIVKNWGYRKFFWKKRPAKFAPCLLARAIWKSKSVKQSLGKFAARLRTRTIQMSKSLKIGKFEIFLEVDFAEICTTPVYENDLDIKIHSSIFRVTGAGISMHCKICGRYRSRSSWGLQKSGQIRIIWRGSEMMLFVWQVQGFRALWFRCLKSRILNPWKECKFHATEIIFCRDHFAWQLQDFIFFDSSFSWQVPYFCRIHFKIVKMYWNSEVKSVINISFFWSKSHRNIVDFLI